MFGALHWTLWATFGRHLATKTGAYLEMRGRRRGRGRNSVAVASGEAIAEVIGSAGRTVALPGRR